MRHKTRRYAPLLLALRTFYTNSSLRPPQLADEDMRNTEIIEDGGHVMGRWVILFGRFRTFLRSFVKKMKVPEDEGTKSRGAKQRAVNMILALVLRLRS